MACFLCEKTNLMRGLPLVPTGINGSFGAKNIPTFLSMALGWPAWSAILMQAALMLVMARQAFKWSTRLQPGIMRLTDAEHVSLTVGAALIVGCFLAGQSIGYRGIHLLFTLPPLLALATEADGKPARVAAALGVVMMWGDALRAPEGKLDRLLWAAQQYAWWVLVTLLLASLLALLHDSAAVRSLSELPAYIRANSWITASVRPTRAECQNTVHPIRLEQDI
jgi:hypothetical protein